MSEESEAAKIGRLGGIKGGPSRAAGMTQKERSESASAAAKARWSLPIATHNGELAIGDTRIPCYVLEDGTRVLSQRGMIESMGMSHGGNVRRTGADRLLRFATGQIMNSFVSASLAARITNPLKFRPIAGGPAIHGYEATILADLCESVLSARKALALQKQQAHIADQCELLVRGFARVGIVALVDEATGYQYDRSREALAKILEAFIAKELAAWAKTFPDDFYREMRRLRNLDPADDTQRPQYFGILTNDIVYRRLAPVVLEELRKRNPRLENGQRAARHHQLLTREVGHPKLTAHLHAVVALMRIANDWGQFERMIDRAFPRFNHTMLLPFAEELAG